MQPNPIRKKLLAIVFIGFTALFIGLIIFANRHSGQGRVNIYKLPEDTLVTVDGKQNSKKTLYLNPGQHTVKGSRSGFKDDTRTFPLKKGEVKDVYLIPAPDSAEAYKWLSDNPQQQYLREKYAGYNSALVQSSINKKYPIIRYLPLDTTYYDIDYGVSKRNPQDPESIAIYVTALPANRQMALDWMKFKGFKPEKLEIVYQDPK